MQESGLSTVRETPCFLEVSNICRRESTIRQGKLNMFMARQCWLTKDKNGSWWVSVWEIGDRRYYPEGDSTTHCKILLQSYFFLFPCAINCAYVVLHYAEWDHWCSVSPRSLTEVFVLNSYLVLLFGLGLDLEMFGHENNVILTIKMWPFFMK